MLSSIPLKQILFLDLETVPQHENWNELSERTKVLWEKKTQFQRKENVSPEEYYYERAGILSEFGKIICLSCGLIIEDKKIRIKSFYGDHEEKILIEFNELLKSNYFKSNLILCAHNGKEFDFPYLARRMMIHQIELPKILRFHGKKPWEIQHLDTMDLWKFGDYKHYTSLDLLSHVFGLPSPKDDMNGSEVSDVYYKDKNLERIKTYCENDVITLINVFRKMRYESVLKRE
ncbi:3'-5' exonuclease [Apibacter sp. B3889]|uniref:3'-5' exonuclease n=1 Tax=unclassified Apibacter TaxID=2630820 RepID=UPI001325F5F4|nr:MULTISPECIES: 3'-5' exonuclease [unclassified Apibacter]MXO34694.1 3'-5' exonuclease [Apibacter sp. B3883]MXO42202.1 3'-5' exonuclease [Apibacter sp. B3889]MXP03772.1 3'-5' exonuclease [Apibacter sp. B3887]MXP07992.1 3'-5' exonuclease [Apibacter sp. B3935]